MDNLERTKDHLDMHTVSQVTDFFKLMGDNTRLSILIALCKKELCVSEIVSVLNLSQPTISHQLKLLKTAKLVKNRRDGRSIYYSLDDEHIENIISMAVEHANEK